MLLYAITDRTALHAPLLQLVEDWNASGVHFIQLRQKDLDPVQLMSLTKKIQSSIDPKWSKLLINLPSTELLPQALSTGAKGIHLAGKPTPGTGDVVRRAFRVAGRQALLSLPCHSLEEVELARKEGADLILFSPIFEKHSAAPQGLEALRQACAIARDTPVFALGGVTVANAADCQAAGAAGVAGIRLFAGSDWRRLTRPPAPKLSGSKHI